MFSSLQKGALRRYVLRKRHLRKVLALLIVPLLFACAGHSLNPNQELSGELALNRAPRSMAVLPFGDDTGVEGIAEFVRAAFSGQLSVLPYQDIELQVVDRRLQAHQLDDYQKLLNTPLNELGRILGCDAVVYGRVIEYHRLFAAFYSQMALGAAIEIWDTRTGRRIWSDRYVERNHEGGIPLSLTDLPLITIRSGMNLRESTKIQTVDELSRHLVSRLPAPATMPDTDAVFASKKTGRTAKLNAKPPPFRPYPILLSKYKSLKRLTKVRPKPMASYQRAARGKTESLPPPAPR